MACQLEFLQFFACWLLLSLRDRVKYGCDGHSLARLGVTLLKVSEMNFDEDTFRKQSHFVGQIEVFEDYPGCNSAVSVFTEEGEEYVVINKKAVKRLLRYAGEEVKVELEGVVDFDHALGLNILNVTSIKSNEEIESRIGRREEKLIDNVGKRKKKCRFEILEEEELTRDDLRLMMEGFDDIVQHEDELDKLLPIDEDEELSLELLDLDLDLALELSDELDWLLGKDPGIDSNNKKPPSAKQS